MTSVAGWPPIVTVAPASKSVPRIETRPPPAGSPETGEIENTMRGDSSEVWPFGSVAVTVDRLADLDRECQIRVEGGVSGAVGGPVGARVRRPSEKSWGRPSQGGLA